MGTRLRILFVSLLAFLAVGAAAAPATLSGAMLADGHCSNSTNWDNLTQSCR